MERKEPAGRKVLSGLFISRKDHSSGSRFGDPV
jgi:hypothetical protein